MNDTDDQISHQDHPILGDLSPKQRRALRAAKEYGFFQRPQKATADEIADELDVSRSTFLHHLRAGERKILNAILDED